MARTSSRTMYRRWRPLVAAVPALLAVGLLPAAEASAARTACEGRRLRVPGAERLVSHCLADLTTTGTRPLGLTNPEDYDKLQALDTVNPSHVPGIQLDGYFPDTSTTNTNNGWNHDSQFVIRLPEHWNGGLVVAGPPGTRRQYANDQIISDQVLARGFAYAATDKGNTGPELYKDGDEPGDAMMEWHLRVAQLTVAAKQVAAKHYGKAPTRTYAAGLSAAGYLVRWQLEHYPQLYTGGIDWNGLLLTRDEPALLTNLPPALRAYPRWDRHEPGAAEAMYAAGYPKGSEKLWKAHYYTLWDSLQRTIREELDPDYDGAAQGGTPFCPEGTGAGCDTDYDYAARPDSVHDAVERVSLTGHITRPLITIQGTFDVLLPITRTGDVYDRMVNDSGRGDLHRYYRIENGTHTDGFYDLAKDVVRPMQPCFNTAFDDLVAWTTKGATPPPSHTLPRAADDTTTGCAL
ncbi:tannase/feruloyl esterase family alpha/beta hydrolase [Kitasatospora xanthocidica]|uniref:tannase/feruloyl esterase family alpha/beta hydrolase n=1 Tax=Kitasatospora xanthocidica TaxID=83382 RepID=UPI001E327F83|nr:tannase/feruloyl esterase family alpha/beta hydrolase [Kitasatospora xanthocidica]